MGQDDQCLHLDKFFLVKELINRSTGSGMVSLMDMTTIVVKCSMKDETDSHFLRARFTWNPRSADEKNFVIDGECDTCTNIPTYGTSSRTDGMDGRVKLSAEYMGYRMEVLISHPNLSVCVTYSGNESSCDFKNITTRDTKLRNMESMVILTVLRGFSVSKLPVMQVLLADQESAYLYNVDTEQAFGHMENPESLFFYLGVRIPLRSDLESYVRQNCIRSLDASEATTSDAGTSLWKTGTSGSDGPEDVKQTPGSTSTSTTETRSQNESVVTTVARSHGDDDESQEERRRRTRSKFSSILLLLMFFSVSGVLAVIRYLRKHKHLICYKDQKTSPNYDLRQNMRRVFGVTGDFAHHLPDKRARVSGERQRYYLPVPLIFQSDECVGGRQDDMESLSPQYLFSSKRRFIKSLSCSQLLQQKQAVIQVRFRKPGNSCKRGRKNSLTSNEYFQVPEPLSPTPHPAAVYIDFHADAASDVPSRGPSARDGGGDEEADSRQSGAEYQHHHHSLQAPTAHHQH